MAIPTVEVLDKDIFSEEIKCVSIGRLSPEMIEFINEHDSSYKNILSSERDIIFWKDRIAHTERHSSDFWSESEYENCLRNIPHIIQEPDYISVSSKKQSLSFIKQYNSNVAVVIRISLDGKMGYRTMYPITSAQISDYVNKGTAWEYKNVENIDNT